MTRTPRGDPVEVLLLVLLWLMGVLVVSASVLCWALVIQILGG